MEFITDFLQGVWRRTWLSVLLPRRTGTQF